MFRVTRLFCWLRYVLGLDWIELPFLAEGLYVLYGLLVLGHIDYTAVPHLLCSCTYPGVLLHGIV